MRRFDPCLPSQRKVDGILKTHIVMISGKQGSGKSTLTRELIRRVSHKKNWDALELRFAKVIYDLHDDILRTMKFYGFDVPVKDGELLQLLGTEWGRKRYGEDIWVTAVKNVIADIEKARLATLEGRKSDGLEVKHMIPSEVPMNENLLLVISDCRFMNEFKAFPEALRVRLRCHHEIRRSRAESWRENAMHASEINLDDVDRAGEFDLYLQTDEVSVQGCADLVLAKLDKGGWIEKRG